MDLDLVIDRELSLVASRGKRPASFERALGLMAGGRIDPARLITHRFPLSEWQKAFAAAERPGAKVVLTMQEVGPSLDVEDRPRHTAHFSSTGIVREESTRP